jgi:hypothetical protein
MHEILLKQTREVIIPNSHTPRLHSAHSASRKGQVQACVVKHLLP